eukprot:TRINITY_DN74452_c0_g1_i1.p1 TRINITY_DN74452_c0_g1~~TRINITY_DN74452_c0_g1_i1.p1  ORF type:complete len:176 (+),score=46.06 TRINITY_DN74452_c0_g1_i1:245-772(+)
MALRPMADPPIEDIDMALEVAGLDADGLAMLEASMGMMQPPPVLTAEQVQEWTNDTDYSEKYCDDVYEYRRVTVPRSMVQANVIPQGRTMTETEWRSHGITMSRGWEHYDHHAPEANVLLFRRVLGTDPRTGEPPPEMAAKVAERMRYVAELEKARMQMLQEQQRRQELAPMDLM